MRRELRLRHRRDFERVYRGGGAWTHPLLIMRAVRNELPLTRVGIVASKRLGGAVVRNRAKRRLREAARLASFDAGWDVVLIARPPVLAARFDAVRSALRQLSTRAGLLAGEGSV